MPVVDLHNHTVYSYDGSNTPEQVIENAIRYGIDVVGITDHQFSICENLPYYFAHLKQCQERYRGKIHVLCGLEIGTRPKPSDLLAAAAMNFDYVLFESLDHPQGMDLFEFFEWRRLFHCKAGLAHTDIFALSGRYGVDLLNRLKKENLFWELNTSGNYNYYYDFLTNPQKQRQVSQSGIEVSIGSDTHCLAEYHIGKIRRANSLVRELGNPLP